MSIHKLTAGSGYDYLTRQVAAQDATDKGHTGLASYYAERGETPGTWVGAGMAGIDGVEAGEVVTADHMQALFGSGHHPLARQREKELDARIGRRGEPSPTPAEYKAATRLGTPYRVYDNDITPFQREVAQRFAAVNEATGLPSDWPIPAEERARIRTQVAREFFTNEHGREPADARELAAVIAKNSRPKTTAVAGYDLTFSPVKSFSVMWALADPATAARLETAHNAAVADTLTFIEDHALFSREGAGGVRQVNVRGLVATAFTHRDSRAGDPDLHTHVAIANKVQTLEGKWLAVDGRTLYKMAVAASEHYNTRLEAHARDTLGVRFAERPHADVRKRPVREIAGIDAGLIEAFSKRRASVEVRRKALVARFQATHGRPPTPVETLTLDQQATLETRAAKHEPRSLAAQRTAWMREATGHLGSAERVQQMIHAALHPVAERGVRADSQWFAQTVADMVATMEGARATWQDNHVIAEAWRRVKAADIRSDRQAPVAAMLVEEVLIAGSVSLARPGSADLAGVTEPAELRKLDGTSKYTVAHTDLYTSARVLAAEARLVGAAGRRGGRVVAAQTVDLALLESTANGVTLNPGQAMLVREMATSGARLQLAIAPAGAGKTTAMRVLARVWSERGGSVIGLAPSAAAAAELGAQFDQTGGSRADTLAKLVWALDHSEEGADLPEWAHQVDPSTLVVIDEAGMADTISLDRAVDFVLSRGGSVRLIGDDQQLAAIGAGGVLRDIQATHGALQLSELMRFTDPAEGAATLAVREGRTEALGFYLDNGRVHIGDQATMTRAVFGSWQADRGRGLDAVMLAPTRDLVAELNQRARAHRLQGLPSGQVGALTRLADGNEASGGDVILTRANDRRLRIGATDWVKNGDRWNIVEVHDGGGLTVKHLKHGRLVRLPASYVATSAELGYACTVHTAQGVTADTMHGLATDDLTRQLLYTMVTRGRLGNHLYLGVVGDGDPHSVIRPELLHPRTPTDLLEQILARDGTPESATTLQRLAADPATLLGQATRAYTDSLHLAAEHVLGEEVVAGLDEAADRVVPGLSDARAWRALRADLLLAGAAGHDPVELLRGLAADRELATADDAAAVLDWRLDASGLRNAGPGPLGWLHAAPAAIARDPEWGPYLGQRTRLVMTLATQVRQRAEASTITPAWATGGARPDPTLVGDVEVWRAAMQVDPADRRPTGPGQQQKAAGTWQRRLARRIAGDRTPAIKEWKHLLTSLGPGIDASDGRATGTALGADEFTPLLAERLASMSRAGLDARGLLAQAAGSGPLPDDHPAAALWWRISRHVCPAVTTRLDDAEQVTVAAWTRQLVALIGSDRTTALQHSSWWPALVSVVDHGLQRGWQLPHLLGLDPNNPATPAPVPGDVDECQAMVWRASIASRDVPTDDPGLVWDTPTDEPPADLHEGYQPTDRTHGWMLPDPDWKPVEPEHTGPGHAPSGAGPAAGTSPAAVGIDVGLDARVDRALLLAGMARDLRLVDSEDVFTDDAADRQLRRAREWDHAPVSRERMLHINQLAQEFFATGFTAPGAWGRAYLAQRFGVDLAGHEHFGPGQAPAGWTHLVDHLHRHGVTDQEMVATGVATLSRRGTPIDRFRDRVMFPITGPGRHRARGPEILGFIGRRDPRLADTDPRTGRNTGPKYLNTPDTPLFHKGAQLYGAITPLLAAGATPVLVEGPTDAIAVTLATAGAHVGVAALGTSLTEDQAAQLARQFQATGRDPIVATDADLAGRLAAERDFWLLTSSGLDPAHAQLPEGSDPARLLADHGPAVLAAALAQTRPLGEALLDERLDHLPAEHARLEAARVLAARPGSAWDPGLARITDRLHLPHAQARRDLAAAVTLWDVDPRRAAADGVNGVPDVSGRLEAAATPAATAGAEPAPAATAAQRWAAVAAAADHRLLAQPDWPLTAEIMQEIADAGHDVAATVHQLVHEAPLGDKPARALRYRLVSRVDVDISSGEPPGMGTRRGIDEDRRQQALAPIEQDNAPRR